MTQKLGNGFEFKKKACFVCGSLNHLIKDYNFYENKMVGKSVLNNKGMATGQREVRPICKNAQRVNHQNKLTHPRPRWNFVSSAVITNSGKDQGIFDSGCSRHMTGNKFYLSDYQNIDGGFVAFARSPKGGKITRKGKIRTGKLDFEDVYFVKELNFNLFSVSQMCDKKNSVLFIETECLILSFDFKLLNESQILLKVPRQNNMYSFYLKNVVPSGGLTCLFAKATIDESNLWHRRLGHVNFKTMNKLVRGNLVRGLPLKFLKMTIHVLPVRKESSTKPHVKPSPRFSWVFFLATKDETPEILKNFITGIENQIDHKVKAIKCDNGTEFKNRIMNEFCKMKGIRREFSVARTPQQSGVAEKKNRTLIEAARTMLADSKLPTTFWAEPVNTACYVQNRVLVIKPHNKTPYELFLGRKPALSFMRPFGCHVTILNTLDHLGTGPNWLFDIDTLTMSMNYQPIFAGNQTNGHASTKANIDAGQAGKKTVPGPQYVLLPFLTSDSQSPKSSEDEVADDARKKNEVLDPANEGDTNGQGEAADTNRLNTVSLSVNIDAHGNNTYMIFTPISATGSFYDNLGGSISVNAATLPNGDLLTDPLMPELEDTADLQNTSIFSGAYNDEDVGAEADHNNLETTMNVNPIPTTRIHKDHPKN
ncbi:putative ribonuclease H-like domain-containing protein [Tanacetum coccineum]